MLLKKVIATITLALLITSSVPASAAELRANPASTSIPATETDPKVQQLLQRLETIKGMDKSGMTKVEKKHLRKEVKSIRKEMKAIKGGVYLSVGAIIIIILLLILLL